VIDDPIEETVSTGANDRSPCGLASNNQIVITGVPYNGVREALGSIGAENLPPVRGPCAPIPSAAAPSSWRVLHAAPTAATTRPIRTRELVY